MSELLLLSGGIDSISIAAWRRPSCCLTIDYGQLPAKAEKTASEAACRELGLHHVSFSVPVGHLGSGAMVGSASINSPNIEFWPFRNQLLLTLGAMYALRFGHAKVLIGTVHSDRRHGDGRPAFIEMMTNLMKSQEGGIELEAPALKLTSTELVQRSAVGPAVLGWAHSCHVANIACGRCPGCNKHSEVMRNLGWNR